MRIPRHWTKASYTGKNLEGKDLTCSAWGWSFDSLAKAKEDALTRARRVFDCLINGRRPDSYEYSDRPLREEIVESIRHDDEEVAVITRNRYGALVLNTASVLFVDIDYPRITPTGLLDAILLAFSRRRREARRAELAEATLQSVRDWSQRNPKHSFRMYRTSAGLRLLFVDKLYAPDADETARILTEMGSDRLYRTLTTKQQCFRARLTPKPWRCGAQSPPSQYPWPDAEAERLYRRWQQGYAETAAGYRVCELIESCGAAGEDDRIRLICERHDCFTCQGRNKPLA